MLPIEERQVLPVAMSLPEIMGDRCASELRAHALALVDATAHAEKLVSAHPGVAGDLLALHDSVARHVALVLERLAAEAGIPPEGESISRHGGPYGDYRIDRSSGCWIWMRRVTVQGYPVIGRKTKGRENVPAKIYWMLRHGPVGDGQLVVRTCSSRLCVNPDHGRVVARRDYAAECMRSDGVLDWDAVREIRQVLAAGRDGLRERAIGLAQRFGVTRHTVLEVFRNKVWVDPDYVPGWEVACEASDCDVVFRTTSSLRRFHSRECGAAATRARAQMATRSSRTSPAKSPGRAARETAALQAELLAAHAEWDDAVADPPRASVWSVASLNQAIGDGSSTLADVIAGVETDDPASACERIALREIVGDLTLDQVAGLDEPQTAAIQARLTAAGMAPSVRRCDVTVPDSAHTLNRRITPGQP